MILCDVCAAEGYPYDKELCKNCEHNPNKEGFNDMESKTIEFDVGLKKVKFNIVKLKDCKYFIEDITYTNPIEYTVNLMLYPEDSPNVDCAIIIVNPASFLTPIEVEEDGSVTNKSITLYYEFDGDSDYYAAFEAKYIDRILSMLSSTASIIISRNGIPMFYANHMTNKVDAVSQTKAELNALIDDCAYRRYSMTNLLCYLDKLRKEERDELY
jgi:hypothetical protein